MAGWSAGEMGRARAYQLCQFVIALSIQQGNFEELDLSGRAARRPSGPGSPCTSAAALEELAADALGSPSRFSRVIVTIRSRTSALAGADRSSHSTSRPSTTDEERRPAPLSRTCCETADVGPPREGRSVAVSPRRMWQSVAPPACMNANGPKSRVIPSSIEPSLPGRLQSTPSSAAVASLKAQVMFRQIGAGSLIWSDPPRLTNG